MLKLNKKGFFLIETLIVVGIAAGVLVLFYKQISNLYNSYENNLNYDTVQSIHAANNLKNFIIQEGRDDVIGALGGNYYLDITTNYDFTDDDYYTSLKNYAKVKKVYITQYNLNPMIDNISSYSFNARYIAYFKTLRLIDTTGTSNKYRILIEMNDGSFSNIIIDKSDITPPVITMLGSANVTVDVGGSYADAGATAYDTVDGTITGSITPTNTVVPTVPGTYTVSYNVKDSAGNAAVTVKRTVTVFEYNYAYSYSGGAQTFTAPYTGTYRIELWGAQGNYGGYYTGTSAGYGGYTSGNLTLNEGQKVYAYIGGGGASSTSGGYNGGGSSGTFGGYAGGGGGGDTDIRVVGGTWNDTISLRNRIMVAAGGGGSGSSNTSVGYAGGLTGGNSRAATYEIYGGNGGTQIAGGTVPTNYSSKAGLTAGSFGAGGNGNASITTSYGAGGGGGYYGGSGGSGAGDGHWGGGGGSSFISGYAGCNAIDSSGNPTGQANHFSGYVFISGTMTMTAGNASMPSPAGGSETGHAGNGSAKITYIP